MTEVVKTIWGNNYNAKQPIRGTDGSIATRMEIYLNAKQAQDLVDVVAEHLSEQKQRGR